MFIAGIHDLNNLARFKESGADGIIVSLDDFAIRFSESYSIDEIKRIKEDCKKLGLLLFVNMQKFIMEEEIDSLLEALNALKDTVDGIYYSDEGLLYAAKSLGMENQLIYQPETLVTSAMDVQYYLNQNIQAVSLANELSLEEILQIAAKTRGVEVMIHGYYSILYSRRALITNYLQAIDGVKEKNQYTIIEQTRQDKMPILEDKGGTHIFSPLPKASFEQLKSLKESGIERFRLESLFLEDEEILKALQTYKAILDGVSPDFNMEGYDDGWYYKKSILKKEG